MTAKEKSLARFAKHLKHIRQNKGYSLREFSSRAGLEYSQVQRIEKGKVNFAFTTLEALAEGLDMTTSELTNY